MKTSATVTGTGQASPGTSTYSLDPFGQVISAVTTGATPATQHFIYDAASQGIASTQSVGGSSWTDNWYRMGGTNMWHYSNRAGFDVRSGDGAASTYTVRSGDTLRTVAQTLWGDVDLWYKLAEANGLSATSSLTEGQSLTIPTGVWRTHQSASTYIPYDAQRFLSLTDPSPAYPAPAPPKADKGCGGFGAILLVVIAVVVVAIVAPPLVGHAAVVIPGSLGLITGTDFGDNVLAALPDVIGSTIGNAVARGVATSQVTPNRGQTASVGSAIRKFFNGDFVGAGNEVRRDTAAAFDDIVVTARRQGGLLGWLFGGDSKSVPPANAADRITMSINRAGTNPSSVPTGPGFGTRYHMLTLERQITIANPGPLNLEPHAVKARVARANGGGQ